MKGQALPVSRIHVVRIDRGEDIATSLRAYCQSHAIRLAAVSAIGAVDTARIGYFETARKVYHEQTVTGDLEIASLTGNVTCKNGDTYLHLHAVLAREDGTCVGGHLNAATVSGTCEVIIHEIQGCVEREESHSVGLNLLVFPH